MQQTFIDASSAPDKTKTSQLKYALVVDNMSYTDSMFLDIYLHSPVHPLNVMVFESRAPSQIQIAGTFHPGGIRCG